MKTYEALIDSARSARVTATRRCGVRARSGPDRVILLGLDIKMFYGGPKEA
jgi:sulfate adenylyltransferase